MMVPIKVYVDVDGDWGPNIIVGSKRSCWLFSQDINGNVVRILVLVVTIVCCNSNVQIWVEELSE